VVVRVYFDQDLRYGLDGLTKICKQKRIGISSMKGDEMVMFINRARKQMKIMWAGRYLFTAYKHAGEGRFRAEDLNEISRNFKADLFNGEMGNRVKNYLGKGLIVVDDGEGLKVS